MSPMSQLKTLEPADFDRLLRWFDSDPDRAGQLYESIRWRLIAVLASRGCYIPEELADDVIDRVARRVKDIEATYSGDKAIYFLGVMNNVHHEYLRRPPVPRLVSAGNDQVEVREQTHVCLDRCLAKLSPHAREIIQQYYAEDKQAKISLRKRIAARFGVTGSNLRLRALRIRTKLQTCIEQCMEMSEARPSGNPPSPFGSGAG
jgi:DNA-directed RNA polymerase specialized sigma24 family protein